MTKIALDTNILIYGHFIDNKEKQTIARDLLSRQPFVSTQVISEYLNVMKRLLKSIATKEDLLDLCSQWMKGCTIHSIHIATIQTAKRLIARYDFQIFDSLIVASALETGCEILYSEDMQHNMLVERQLTIINPFI
ncbi:MAG: PIN domain-containing protein [Dysgonamonadaceae bacterium]|jgi:predicted nucleic acid-binding protein|nr:PIN domain-containing protein [Dysgonamonadaceae bacterium]